MPDLPPDHNVPFLLLGAFNSMTDEVNRRLATMGFEGVRNSHGFAMQAIGDGCTSVQLGQRLGISKQAAAKTVQGLESMGFVDRTPNPADARELLVAPTARGRKMLRLSGEAFAEIVAGWRSDLGDRNVDALLKTLVHAGRPRDVGGQHG
ncbi:MarR family winged helix-turn-helix transcriptional regulator [Jongsikchunia kroppenstedtii]|uniref:MarR family winged helix-turn-helix transcriptional regulator n=1 Tax=Jongsikchunia kroppenstedtii TaxID=1121721 RepID=UPI0003709680|nr:MarR family winged helix-turn-helix transcriptional regulator [Jongsikchunia kroppenstedtii]